MTVSEFNQMTQTERNAFLDEELRVRFEVLPNGTYIEWNYTYPSGKTEVRKGTVIKVNYWSTDRIGEPYDYIVQMGRSDTRVLAETINYNR